jgi:putative ABC transport system permease protein
MMIAFVPTIVVLLVMHRWSRGPGQAVWANVRMFVQLLLVGYVLTFIFETESPWLIAGVIVVMLGFAAWIAMRPLEEKQPRHYLAALAALGIPGLAVLYLVTQWVIDMPRWFEPRFVVPIAGMIFANAMNSVSLAAERFAAEIERDGNFEQARNNAFDAALIPQINSLLAVGLVSLPGMMTGQILAGIEPLVAVRYQIVVMCMIFGSAGLAAAGYLAAMRTAPRGVRPNAVE